MQAPVTRAFLGLIVVTSFISSAFAQHPTPRLTLVTPTGGKQDSQIQLTIKGENTNGIDGLRFSHAGITAKQVTQASPFHDKPLPVENRFDVSIGKDVPAGIYDVRGVGSNGVTNPIQFVVDRLDQLAETGGNQSIEKAMEVPVNSVVTGTSNGASFDFFKFTAKKGQRVLVECLASRIGSAFDAVMELRDADGKRILTRRSGVDEAIIDFTSPVDGDFYVRLSDLTFAGGESLFYRLYIHDTPHVDFVYPAAGTPGKKSSVTVFGRNLPGGSPAKDVEIDGVPLDQLTVDVTPATQATLAGLGLNPSSAAVTGTGYLLAESKKSSNTKLISFVSASVLTEKEGNDTPETAQKVTVPCEFFGKFGTLDDQDWITFDAKKDDSFYIEVFSQRLNAPTDPVLAVQRIKDDGKGNISVQETKTVDDFTQISGYPGLDTPTADPLHKLDVKEDGTYRVQVRNLYGSADAGPRHLYRLSIRKPEPDFKLIVDAKVPDIRDKNTIYTGAPIISKGQVIMMPVVILRRDGFKEDVSVTMEGLPKGVSSSTAVLKGSDKSVDLMIWAAKDAAAWSGPAKVIGKAKINDKEVTREANVAGLIRKKDRNQPRLDMRFESELAIAVTDNVAGVQLEPSVPTLEAKPEDKVELPVKLSRNVEGIKGDIKIEVRGLPKEIKANQVTVKEDAADGKFELTVAKDTKPGTHVLYLRTQAKIPYQPVTKEAAEQAKKDKEAFDNRVKEIQAESNKANSEKTKAANALKAAETKFKAAEKAGGDEATKAKQDLDAAKKASEEAAAAATKAADLVKAAQVEQARLKKVMDDANKGIKVQNVDVEFFSTPVTLTVAKVEEKKK